MTVAQAAHQLEEVIASRASSETPFKCMYAYNYNRPGYALYWESIKTGIAVQGSPVVMFDPLRDNVWDVSDH